jgi:hypothetical protein
MMRFIEKQRLQVLNGGWLRKQSALLPWPETNYQVTTNTPITLLGWRFSCGSIYFIAAAAGVARLVKTGLQELTALVTVRKISYKKGR